jgi:hypothetical protein
MLASAVRFVLVAPILPTHIVNWKETVVGV